MQKFLSFLVIMVQTSLIPLSPMLLVKLGFYFFFFFPSLPPSPSSPSPPSPSPSSILPFPLPSPSAISPFPVPSTSSLLSLSFRLVGFPSSKSPLLYLPSPFIVPISFSLLFCFHLLLFLLLYHFKTFHIPFLSPTARSTSTSLLHSPFPPFPPIPHPQPSNISPYILSK